MWTSQRLVKFGALNEVVFSTAPSVVLATWWIHDVPLQISRSWLSCVVLLPMIYSSWQLINQESLPDGSENWRNTSTKRMMLTTDCSLEQRMEKSFGQWKIEMQNMNTMSSHLSSVQHLAREERWIVIPLLSGAQKERSRVFDNTCTQVMTKRKCLQIRIEVTQGLTRSINRRLKKACYQIRFLMDSLSELT